MKIYLLSPEAVPMNQVLFPTFIKTFESKGHSFVDRIEDCDVVFFDLHSRLSNYNQHSIDFILDNTFPVVTFDEWDRGNMSKDEWPYPLTEQQQDVFNIHWDKKIHFCRLLDKTKTYPPNLHPYEKPVLYEEPILSKEDLFNRSYDVVFIANASPSREAIAKEMINDKRLKVHVSLGAEKIQFPVFVDWHKKGKLFVSSGAGGYSNERPQYLFSIAGMIQEETDQLLAHPFTDMENCIKINNPPTKKDMDKIYEVVNDKDKLYEIYRKNYDFMKTYYSEKAFANYILETSQKHLV